MSEEQVKKLYNSMTNISEEIIEEAQTAKPRRKAPVWVKWCAAAACVCLIAAGAFALFGSGENGAHKVLQWSERFAAADYFKYTTAAGEGMSSSGSIADSAIPYAETRYFSDMRGQMEADGVIPVIDTHPLFTCGVHYNADGSIYSVELSWNRRGDLADYSDLKITAGYQEVPRIQDCIAIELDEDGNVVEPTVTVTERDGVLIVAEGSENREKTVTFQNDSGWYQITGSWNDGYEPVVMLLDWLWEHPLDFTRFPMDAGDAYTLCSLAGYPGAFSAYLPDFAAFGFIEEETWLTLKNGVPVRFEGHYAADSDGALVSDAIHWCLETEPDIYDLQDCIGELDQLTEQAVTDVLAEESHISFTWDGYCVTVYPKSAQEAWALIASLQG